MSSNIFAVQQAVYAALISSAALNALVNGRIYDEVPVAEPTYPYLSIGETITNRFDTKDWVGWDIEMTLHIWSRYRGKKETEQISAAVEDALHRQTLNVSGGSFVRMDVIQRMSFEDSDGLTRHGVVRLQIISQ